MSAKGWAEINITPTSNDDHIIAELDKFAAEQNSYRIYDTWQWSQHPTDPIASLGFSYESTWLQDLLDELKSSLTELNLEPSNYTIDIVYTSDDDPNEDGAVIDMHIENGKIASYKESRVTMVETEPNFTFEMK